MFQKTSPSLFEWTEDEELHEVNKNLMHNMTDDHREKFLKSINLFPFAPVLNFENELLPLNYDVSTNE